MRHTDEDVASRVKKGDREAFEMLVARHEKSIFNTAFRMVNDLDDAADITQNAFVKAYERIDSYDSSFKFFSWLYRIAINESLNHIKRRNRNFDLSPDQPSTQPTPEDEYALTEMSNLLQTALMAMTFEHRVVIVLKHLLYLSYREIAEILEISEKTVKSRLFSARQVLKKQMVKLGYAG